MAYIPVNKEPKFNTNMDEITTRTPVGAKAMNPRYQQLLENDEYLHQRQGMLGRVLIGGVDTGIEPNDTLLVVEGEEREVIQKVVQRNKEGSVTESDTGVLAKNITQDANNRLITDAERKEISDTKEALSAETKNRTNADTALSVRIDEAKAIAEGRSRSRVFLTEAEMNVWLAVTENKGKLNIGDNLYIIDMGVPDYWWDGTKAQILESEKVDLTDFYTKQQIDLLLNSKVSISDFQAALDGKAEKAHGNHVPYIGITNNAVFLRNDNTWQYVTPDNIGAARLFGYALSSSLATINQWTKVLEFKTNSRYGDCSTIFRIANGADGNKILHIAEVGFRVKQQSELGSPPLCELVCNSIRGWFFHPFRFVAVIVTNDTSLTHVELYYKSGEYHLEPRVNIIQIHGNAAYFANQGYNKDLPDGTQIVCEDVSKAEKIHTHGTWADQSEDVSVARDLRWTGGGNHHVIADNSDGNWGNDKVDAKIPWQPSYPSIMGYNGGSTVGVRVDSARLADEAVKLASTEQGTWTGRWHDSGGSEKTPTMQYGKYMYYGNGMVQLYIYFQFSAAVSFGGMSGLPFSRATGEPTQITNIAFLTNETDQKKRDMRGRVAHTEFSVIGSSSAEFANYMSTNWSMCAFYNTDF